MYNLGLKSNKETFVRMHMKVTDDNKGCYQSVAKVLISILHY